MKRNVLIAGTGLFLVSLAPARPLLPEAPVGTGSAAFAGGGAGHSGGVNSVFDNPAGLSLGDEFQAEAGMMGLSAGLSPYFLFGSRGIGNSAYALGYFLDAREGNPRDPAPTRQGLIAGASWEAFPHLILGASLRNVGMGAGIGSRGFGIDGDAGALAYPGGPWRVGLAVRNLMESGVGREPSGFRTQRGYALSLGAGVERLRLPGFVMHEPDAYYEVRTQGMPLSDPTQAFSLAAAFTPGGRLGLRGTLLLPSEGATGYALGTFLNLPIGRGGLMCAYVLQVGEYRETGESEISHAISFRFSLGARRDPARPNVEVRADPLLAIAADDESPDVYFSLYAQDRIDARIKEWKLEIRIARGDGTQGEVVRTFQGRDLPPRAIRWNGENQAGERLPPGIYAFRLNASYGPEIMSATAWQLLEIATP